MEGDVDGERGRADRTPHRRVAAEEGQQDATRLHLARRGCENSRIIGRLDGSIIAATITCHATRNTTAVTQNGGVSTTTHSGRPASAP